MHVTLDRVTGKEGLIFKKDSHTLNLTVVFSEEEKFAIDQAGIRNHIFFTKKPWKEGLDDHQNFLSIYVKDLLKCKTRSVAYVYNLVDLNEEEQKVREALKDLKAAIEGTKEIKAQDTFEL